MMQGRLCQNNRLWLLIKWLGMVFKSAMVVEEKIRNSHCAVRKTLIKAWVIFNIQFYVKNKGKLQVLFARKYAFILAIV